MSVEMRHLRAFHAVAEELSFRRAADRIGITQPALSRRIKELEEIMGVVLFERTTRVIRLTEPGEAFLAQTRRLTDGLEQAIGHAQRVQLGVAGELRVGFNDFAISGHLPEIVRRFRASHANIEVSLIDATTPEMLDMVLDGDIDIAFHMGPHSHPDLDRLVVRNEVLVCVLPASHPLARHDRIAIADLAQEAFIMGRWDSWKIFHRLIRDFCRAHGFLPRIIQEAEHADGIMGLVAAEMGVTLYVDSDWVRSMKGVVMRPLAAPIPRIETLATWRQDRRMASRSLDEFVQTIIDTV